MKTLALAIFAAAALSGCAVYPAYPGYTTYGPYGGAYVAPAPVYVYPSFGLRYGYGPRIGVYGGYGGYYGGYGHYGGRGPYVRPYAGHGYRR